MAETESSIASTPITTRTILTVLDTYVLRCFLRELEAARACCSGVGAASEFFFLFAIVGLSHHESNKRHCVTMRPPRHTWHMVDKLICTILVQRGQLWQPAVRDIPFLPAVRNSPQVPALKVATDGVDHALACGLAEHIGCGVGIHKDIHKRLQGLDLAARLGDARLMMICAGTGAPMPAIALNTTGAAGFTTAI